MTEHEYVTVEACNRIMDNKEAHCSRLIEESGRIRTALWEGIGNVETKVDRHKEIINGKFDKIMYSFIAVLIAIVGSFVGNFVMQQNTARDVTERLKAQTEGRAYHVGISEDNNKELAQVLDELKTIQKEIKAKKVTK